MAVVISQLTNLSVQISLRTLFLKHDMDEITVCSTAAELHIGIELKEFT